MRNPIRRWLLILIGGTVLPGLVLAVVVPAAIAADVPITGWSTWLVLVASMAAVWRLTRPSRAGGAHG